MFLKRPHASIYASAVHDQGLTDMRWVALTSLRLSQVHRFRRAPQTFFRRRQDCMASDRRRRIATL